MGKTRVCVFCGKELTGRLGLGEQYVDCGGGYELACNVCEGKLRRLEAVERCKLALESGRAAGSEKLKEYLLRNMDALEATYSGQTCLRCGGRMKAGGKKRLFMSDYGVMGPGEGLNEGLIVDIQYCEACGKLEFYWEMPGK